MIKYADTSGHKTYSCNDGHFIMIVAAYRGKRVFIHTNSLSVVNYLYSEWGKLPKTLEYDRFSVQLYKYGWSAWKLEYSPIVAKYIGKYAEKVRLEEI